MEGRKFGGLRMGLDYYYKNEADKYSFIRIPKAMMTEEMFSSLSVHAKILYGMLLYVPLLSLIKTTSLITRCINEKVKKH